MAKVSKFYPLYAINVWHADRQTFPFLQKCHYHVNKTKKKQNSSMFSGQFVMKSDLRSPHLHIYIYVSLTVVRSFPLPNVAHQSCKLIALCSLACSAMPICFMSTIRGKEGASKPHVFVWKETKHYLLQWDHRDHSVLWGWLDFRNSNKILNDRKTDDLL